MIAERMLRSEGAGICCISPALEVVPYNLATKFRRLVWAGVIFLISSVF